MTWLFRDGVQLTKNPAGTYVYRWWHLDVPRYVGVGKGSRWRSHLDGTRDVNPKKADYFILHRTALACETVQAELTKEEAHELESDLIREHGLLDAGGTLLNWMLGAAAPKRTGRGTPASKRLYFALMKLPPFAPNAIITVCSPNNPKRLDTGGWTNFELYPPCGKSISVGEHNDVAKAHGFIGRSQHEHLCWDAAHRFISVALPDGESAPAGTTVPTEEFMREIETQLGMHVQKVIIAVPST